MQGSVSDGWMFGWRGKEKAYLFQRNAKHHQFTACLENLPWKIWKLINSCCDIRTFRSAKYVSGIIMFLIMFFTVTVKYNQLNYTCFLFYIYTSVIKQQMHFFKYVQLHIITLHQHVSVTPLTFIRVSCNKSTIRIQIIVQNYRIKLFTVILDFSLWSLWP